MLRRLLAIGLVLLLALPAWGGIVMRGSTSEASGQFFWDTFDRANSTDLGSDWTETNGDLSISSNNLTTGAFSGATVWNTQASTAAQWVCVDKVTNNSFDGPRLRGSGVGSTATSYVFREDGTATTLVFRYCTGTTCTTIGSAFSAAVDTGWVCFAVTGTNTATVFKAWDEGATNPCDDVTPGPANWGTCDYGLAVGGGTGCANDQDASAWGTYYDAGLYVGYYNGAGTTATIGEWCAGDQ